MYSRFRRRAHRRSPGTEDKSQPLGADVFICGDDYSIAGFAFELREEVLRPVDKIAPISLIDGSIAGAIATMAERRTIDSLIVPPVPERDEYNNPLLKSLPASYRTRVAKNNPSFAQCCAVRSVALGEERLIESDYAGSEKVLAQLRQCCEDRPPTPLMWSYLRGLYELLSNPPMKLEHFYRPDTERSQQAVSRDRALRNRGHN